MSKGSRYTVLLALALFSLSCDHSFSPKEVTGDQFVLQCFVEGGNDRSPMTQSLLVARVYDVEGLDPLVNADDPAVRGAEIKFAFSGKQYTLRESTRASVDTARYGSQQRYYYATVTMPIAEEVLSVMAKLPSGKILSAQTTVPRSRAFTHSYAFAQGITTRVNLPPGVRNWTIDWEDYREENPGHLFFARLTISYLKRREGIDIPGAIEVPSSYVQTATGWIPVYPRYSTQMSCYYEFPAIDSAMSAISAGDPDKSNYSMHEAVFELIEYDTPLSKYFSSISGSLDQFSIRINQTIYSNIGGGVGVFGSYFVNRAYFDLDAKYVESFGYKFR